MPKKDKLSKEERSQIAKDRWTKIKAAKEQDATQGVDASLKSEENPVVITIPAPSGRDENGVPSIVGLGDGTITPNGAFIPDQSDIVLSTSGVYRQNPDGSFTEIGKGIDAGQGLSPSAPIAPAPVPQLTPVAPKRPKRYQGPKEFSVPSKRLRNAWLRQSTNGLRLWGSWQDSMLRFLASYRSFKP